MILLNHISHPCHFYSEPSIPATSTQNPPKVAFLVNKAEVFAVVCKAIDSLPLCCLSDLLIHCLLATLTFTQTCWSLRDFVLAVLSSTLLVKICMISLPSGLFRCHPKLLLLSIFLLHCILKNLVLSFVKMCNYLFSYLSHPNIDFMRMRELHYFTVLQPIE